MGKKSVRRKQQPGPQVFGDLVIYRKYVEYRNNGARTARFFNKGVANVYPSAKQVVAAVERHINGTSAAYWTNSRSSNAGRMPVLDAQGIKTLQDEEAARKQEERLVRLTTAECHRDIMRERCKMVVRRQLETSLETFDPLKYKVTEAKLKEFTHKIWPERRSSKPVTDSREKAKNQLRNAISVAVVGGSVFRRTNPACIITMDHMACFIDKHNRVQITHAAAGSQAEMRKKVSQLAQTHARTKSHALAGLVNWIRFSCTRH